MFENQKLEDSKLTRLSAVVALSLGGFACSGNETSIDDEPLPPIFCGMYIETDLVSSTNVMPFEIQGFDELEGRGFLIGSDGAGIFDIQNPESDEIGDVNLISTDKGVLITDGPGEEVFMTVEINRLDETHVNIETFC